LCRCPEKSIPCRLESDRTPRHGFVSGFFVAKVETNFEYVQADIGTFGLLGLIPFGFKKQAKSKDKFKHGICWRRCRCLCCSEETRKMSSADSVARL
jgi:hypothetical protein